MRDNRPEGTNRAYSGSPSISAIRIASTAPRRAGSAPCGALLARSRTTRRARSRARSRGRRGARASGRPPPSAHATAWSSRARPTPRRRWLAATIRPRSATWRLAGWTSRASDSLPTMRSVRPRRTIDRRVGVTSNRTQVPPLLGDAPPRLRRQQPRALLAADLARELDERLAHRPARRGRILITGRRPRDRHGVGRRRRRGARPAAARRRRRRRSRGSCPPTGSRASPPRCSCSARLLRPTAFDLDDPVLDVKPRMVDRVGRPRGRRRRRGGSSAGSPRRACTEPALPTTRRGSLAVEHERRSHHARQSVARQRARPCRSRRARPACCSAGTPGRRRPSRSRASRRARPHSPHRRSPRHVSSRSEARAARSRRTRRGARRRARRRAPARSAALQPSSVCEPGGDDGAAERRRRARGDSHAAERRLHRSALDHPVRGDVGGEIGDELGDRGRAAVAQALEPGTIAAVSARECEP